VSYSVKALLRATASVAIVLALCFALVLGLLGCGGDKSSSTTGQSGATVPGGTVTSAGQSAGSAELVGKWYCERLKETLEFTADGKMIWTKDGGAAQTFTYTVNAGSIVFKQPNAPADNSLPFTVAGSTLTTQDTKYGSLTYTKK
jgi:hypothetical protein